MCFSCLFAFLLYRLLILCYPERSAAVLAAANGDPGKHEKNKMLLCTALEEISHLYNTGCSCIADYLVDVSLLQGPLKFVDS